MNVSNLDLSRELYELSGWRDTFSVYEQTDGIPMGKPYIAYPELEKRYGLWGTQELKKRTPAYDLGYLLCRLPYLENWDEGVGILGIDLSPPVRKAHFDDSAHDDWIAHASTRGIDEGGRYHGHTQGRGDTPEDAVAKLAIELFKRGVLKRGSDE